MEATLTVDIPPLEHISKAITYTCTGQGLLKDGFEYDAHPERFFPPKPSRAAKDGAPVEAPHVEKKSAAWWKAQCAFRGLNQSGAINDLQLRLKEAKKKMLPELKEVETQLNKEYKKKCKSAKDDSWKQLKSAEQKATKDPTRFLLEAFPKAATGRPANLDIVVLKVEGRAAISIAAEKLGLETVSVDAPWTSNKKPSPDRWIVVGRTRDAVWDQMRDIEREALRSKENIGKEKIKTHTAKPGDIPGNAKSSSSKSMPLKKEAVKQSAPSSVVRALKSQSNPEPVPRPKQTARRAAPFGMSRAPPSLSKTETLSRSKQTAKRGGHSASMSRMPAVVHGDSEQQTSQAEPKVGIWDVTGSYEIYCPAIEDERGSDESLSLDVHLEKLEDTYQMFADFNFSIVEGIFRFEKPVPVSKSEPNGSKKRKREDDEDEDGDIDMSGVPIYANRSTTNERTRYSEKVFHLGPKDKPTARRPTWRFRWRGQETGEGVIELGSDQYVQTITFSDKGQSLSGTFNCNSTGDCDFTGVKKSAAPIPRRRLHPKYCWDEYSEEAYERARIERWH